MIVNGFNALELPLYPISSDISYILTFTVSIGWITKVEIIPERPPITKGYTASIALVKVLSLIYESKKVL